MTASAATPMPHAMASPWRRTVLAVEATQGAASLYCLLLGSLMLLVPHAFTPAVYWPLQPQLHWWGVLFTTSGAALVLAMLHIGEGQWRIALHLPAIVCTITMAALGAGNGHWQNVAVYGLLSLALAYSAGQPTYAPEGSHTSLLAGYLGSIGILNGVNLLVQPGSLRTPLFDDSAWQWAFGLAFLVTGAITLVGQIVPAPLARVRIPAQLGLAALLFTSTVLFSLPFRAWATVVYSASFGMALALQPWLGPRLEGAGRSLRARLALGFAAAAALPLIAAVSLVSSQHEGALRADIRVREANVAQTSARDIERYITLHLAAMVALADVSATLTLPREQQAQRLAATTRAYPDLASISIVDEQGRQLVRADGQPLADIPPSGERREVFDRLRDSRKAEARLVQATSLGPPVLAFLAPVVDAAGAFRGAIVGGVTAERLSEIIGQTAALPGRSTTVVDDQGRVVAQSNAALASAGTDISDRPAVQAALRGFSGPVAYGEPPNDGVAGLARIPSTGWHVILERSIAAAMEAEHASREQTFILLWSTIILSALAGLTLAGRIVRPIRALALAVDQFGSGVSVPVSAPSTREVARLSTGFERMRHDVLSREQHLRESEARYRLLFAQNPAPAWVFDCETLRFMDVNEAAIEHYGYTLEEFAALSIIDLVPEESQPLLMASLGNGLTLALQRPTRHKLKDGRVIDVEVSWRNFEMDGRQCRLTVAHDVTDRVEAQRREREAREQAERALAIREEFFTIAAHELKTPITVLRGQSQLNLRRIRRDGTVAAGTVIEAFNVIEEQSRKLQRLVEQLLDLARIETGRLTLEIARTDVLELLQATVRSARMRGGDREILLHAPDVVFAEVDALRLEQVVSNLLDNAMKYSPVDRPIEISLQVTGDHGTERSSAPRSPRQGTLRIAIRDYGRGIPADDQQRIFQRFQQVHPNDHVKGFGLGLFVCREILELHGGSIEVRSPEGGGSEFVVTLPMVASAVSNVGV